MGDLYTKDAVYLANLLSPLGENVIRCSMDQNFYLRNIPDGYLTKVFLTLKNITNFYQKPKIYSNMIACTGADTCKLGICLPRNLTPKIQDKLDLIDNEILDNVHDLKINISGCPNSCGQHHVGDLGFFGRIRKTKDNRSFPAYNIIGGAIIKPGETRLGLDAGWVHSKDLPDVIKDIVTEYETEQDNFDDFAEYFDAIGREVIEDIAKEYNSRIPSFDDDKNYYFDWGAEKIFSTEGMGSGECSAGIFDMIGVDQKIILKTKNEYINSKSDEEKEKLLYKILLHSSRMLLVTRGVDTRSEKEVYDNFIKHFIDKDLIDNRFRPLIDSAIKHHLLSEKEVLTLSDAVIALYSTMDKSMKFPGETTNMAIDTSVAKDREEPAKNEHAFKDLRGVACPMNFVKTKMELHKIKSGEELEILLDDGAPIDNVPGSVKGEGHEILLQEKEGEHWKVIIKKV